MSQWTMADIERLNALRGTKMPAHIPAKPSKYRNVRTLTDGIVFDSKREANYWLVLKARESAGEISQLRRQVKFPLYTPELHSGNAHQYTEDSQYVADYTFRTPDGELHVVDAKGKRTREYMLKAKRLLLQHGIQIEEV